MSDNGWIGVDLDGTLAEYTGWKGSDYIGKPISAMVDKVKKWLADGETVKIFTARVHGSNLQEDMGMITLIENWCLKNIGQKLSVTCIKDKNMKELWDDKARQVILNTGLTPEENSIIERMR